MSKKAYKYQVLQEVYFLNIQHIEKWKIQLRDKIELDDKQGIKNGYIIKVVTEAQPMLFEDAFMVISEDEVFATKEDLIKSIDKT